MIATIITNNDPNAVGGGVIKKERTRRDIRKPCCPCLASLLREEFFGKRGDGDLKYNSMDSDDDMLDDMLDHMDLEKCWTTQ